MTDVEAGGIYTMGTMAITTPINSNYSLVTRVCLLRSSSELDIQQKLGRDEDDANSIGQMVDKI